MEETQPLGPRYQEKAAACLSAMKALGCKPADVVGRYANECFPDSDVSKASFFADVLRAAVRTRFVRFADERCDLPHFKDHRSPIEYAADLVYGWMIEDAVVARLIAAEGVVVLHGEDRHREFLPARRISSQPDLQIGLRPRLLEVFADWTNHWVRRRTFDLRDAKYERLRGESALMFCISPGPGLGCVLDFADDTAGFEPAFIPAYRKNGYTSRTIADRLRPLDEAVGRIIDVARGTT